MTFRTSGVTSQSSLPPDTDRWAPSSDLERAVDPSQPHLRRSQHPLEAPIGGLFLGLKQEVAIKQHRDNDTAKNSRTVAGIRTGHLRRRSTGGPSDEDSSLHSESSLNSESLRTNASQLPEHLHGAPVTQERRNEYVARLHRMHAFQSQPFGVQDTDLNRMIQVNADPHPHPNT